MITVTSNADKFNAGMQNLVTQLGLKAPVVIKKECGELMKTLVRFTPPTNLAKSRSIIAKQVNRRFEKANELADLASGSGEKWYHATPDFLFGIAPELDKRKAGVDEIRALYFTIQPSGSRHVPFKFPRKVQQVRLAQNILAKPATVRKLIKRFQDNIGRLKAGWWASWPVTMPSGSNMPPAWVMRHVGSGTRGRYIDQLGVRGFPKFSIGNYAQGIGKQREIVQRALKTRAGAMGANLRAFLRGKKQLSDYAK
jgi:hypothetical protein